MRRRRGQSLAEFALTAAIIVALLTTIASVIPAIGNRNAVIQAMAEVAADAPRFVAYDGNATGAGAWSAETRRQNLCAALIERVRAAIAIGLPEDSPFTVASGACAAAGNSTALLTAPVAGNNPVLNVRLICDADPNNRLSGNCSHGSPYGPSDRIIVCLAYRWNIPGGILFAAPSNLTGISRRDLTAVNYRFCAPEITIDAYRSR